VTLSHGGRDAANGDVDATSGEQTAGPPAVAIRSPAMKERADLPAVNVAELEEGLRQLHKMEMQTKLRLEQVEAQLAATIKVLERAELLHHRAVDAEADEQRVRLAEERRSELRVVLGPDLDKYKVEVPKIDCAARMHLCKARCCRLSVALDFVDLDDGLRWEYARPYELKRDKTTGYCVYSEEKTHACNAYEVRPAVCRVYDCSQDTRVWEDFEKRIPAPWMEDVSITPLVQIRLPKK
jgi:Fe-S-cluster containining protein